MRDDDGGLPGLADDDDLEGWAVAGHDEATADTLVMVVGPARYAVGMTHVGEVGRAPGLTRVPGLPGWVAGVSNWRGRVLAVLDLAEVLGERRTGAGRRGRLVVLRTPGATVGLLTDAVAGVRHLGDLEVGASPSTLPPATAALLLGQVETETGPVGLLDVEALVGLRTSLPGSRRSA